nr:norsolorinic acid ketoreductase [Quercus suber]
MAPSVVLITGTNRGIGNGLLKNFLQKSNHLVIAANRDPATLDSQALLGLPTAEGTKLKLIKIDATVPTDPSSAVEHLQSEGIDHVDIMICNAGIATHWPKVRDVKTEDMQHHAIPNVYGLVWLFQAFLPLLKASEKPTWVTIGSSAAYLTDMIPMQNAAYAPTKVVGHWLTKAISIEEPWLSAFPVDPGWVQTDLGNRGAAAFNFEKAAVSIEDSTAGIVKVIDASTPETHSGKMWVWTGSQSAW